MGETLPVPVAAMLGLAMFAALALIWGGVVLFRRGDRQKGVLMIVCAAVVMGNVAIWTV